MCGADFINMKGELSSYIPDYIHDQMINLRLDISAENKTLSINASSTATPRPPYQLLVSL